jgi:hypothetical protein
VKTASLDVPVADASTFAVYWQSDLFPGSLHDQSPIMNTQGFESFEYLVYLPSSRFLQAYHQAASAS